MKGESKIKKSGQEIANFYSIGQADEKLEKAENFFFVIFFYLINFPNNKKKNDLL